MDAEGDIIGWFMEKGRFVDTCDVLTGTQIDLCSDAAAKGRLDVLKYANEKGYKMDECVSIEAALHGRLHILVWIEENKGIGLYPIYEHAAKGGHLHVLKWAKEKGYNNGSEEESCLNAAREGHLHVLKWILKCLIKDAKRSLIDSYFSVNTVEQAIKGEHIHILQWMKDKGLKCIQTSYTHDRAVKYGQKHVLLWVEENGYK